MRGHDVHHEAAADGIAPGKIAPRESFIDDVRSRLIVNIFLLEAASRAQTNAQSAKVRWADGANLRYRKVAGSRRRRTCHGKASQRMRRRQRQSVGDGGGSYSGNTFDLLLQASGKSFDLLRRGVEVVGQIDLDGQQVIGAKSGIDGQQLLEAAQ